MVIFILLMFLFLAACEEEGIIGGEDDWKTDTPESHGLSTENIEAVTAVGKIKFRQCFNVVKNDVLIHESYFPVNGRTRNFGYSMAKSFSATVIGIAQYQGYLTLDDKISSGCQGILRK